MPHGANAMLNNKDGFTLIEFLVALVILMVGMLGMLQAINLAMDKNLESVFRNEAVMLADETIMTEVRNKSFESVSTTVASPPKTGALRNIQGIFKNYSVQKIVSQPTAKSKEVVINVTWKKKDVPYSHSVSTVISSF